MNIANSHDARGIVLSISQEIEAVKPVSLTSALIDAAEHLDWVARKSNNEAAPYSKARDAYSLWNRRLWHAIDRVS